LQSSALRSKEAGKYISSCDGEYGRREDCGASAAEAEARCYGCPAGSIERKGQGNEGRNHGCGSLWYVANFTRTLSFSSIERASSHRGPFICFLEGADTIFRSEESTITDDDIDVILERGAARTKELADKIQKADKGDLLDFRLDGGIATQTFEGIDYSDKELRDHLRMLAADSMGKRERRPPPKDYQPIIQSKKSMFVNNKKIKLPKTLRIPSMEDHHFYNRERLLELGKLEFETYAHLREVGQLPPREILEHKRSLLPGELAQEKIELLDEGFGDWTKSQCYLFVKANAKYGRDDIANIASDMDKQEEEVAAYSNAFFKFGPTELKKEEVRFMTVSLH